MYKQRLAKVPTGYQKRLNEANNHNKNSFDTDYQDGANKCLSFR
jgi:hypothetical protein